MNSAHLIPVLRELELAAASRDGGSLTDGQLLDCFLGQRDEMAFSALVRRHGPMVMGVCRRIVGNVADAEDAFQATFLVLVRKAASIAPRERVGNWLYGVAYRTALEARTLRARRRAHETPMPQLPEPACPVPPPEPDWQPLLDQELSRLPDKYRVPLVLCDLEGRSRKEVAGQLHVPEGTLSSRLSAARKLLAHRLGRRGLACSAGFLAAAPAAVSAALLGSTVRTALLLAAGSSAPEVVPGPVAVLAKGVLQTMLLLKLRVAAVLLIAIALLTGAGVMLAQPPAGKPADIQPPRPANQLFPIQARDQGDMRTESFLIRSIDADKGLLSVVSNGNPHANSVWGDGRWANLPGQASNCTACHVAATTNLNTWLDVTGTNSRGAVIADIDNDGFPDLFIASGIHGGTFFRRPGSGIRLLELQVRPTTQILIDGKERKLGDLKTGIPVWITYRTGEKPLAVSITAQGKTSAGVVSEVDLDTSTLSLQQEEDGKDEIVESDHVVVKDSRIVINGKAGKLQDLKPGMRVSVQHSAVKPVLVAVTAAGPRVEGVLAAIDPKARTLTLILKNLHLPTSPVSLAADAAIQVNGRPATLADLKPGMRVTLRMAAESDRSVIIRVSTVRVVRKTSG